MGGVLTAFATQLAQAHREGTLPAPSSASELLVHAAKSGDLEVVRSFLAAYLATGQLTTVPEPRSEAAAAQVRQLASFQKAELEAPQRGSSLSLPSSPMVVAPPPPPPQDTADPDGTAEMDRGAVERAIARRALPFEPTVSARPGAQVMPPRPQETVLLRGPVLGEVSGGTVMLSSDAAPPVEVPFTIAPTKDAANAGTLPFLPLETFAAIATAMMRGENPASLFATHAVHPMQYLQCSRAFYERSASDPDFKRALDEAMTRAQQGRR